MRNLISLLTLSGILVFGAVPSNATPIKIDLKKLLDQAENVRPYEYMPARVGWNGPEKAPISAAPTVRLADAETRQWLVKLAIPDPKMLMAFAAAIVGLRIIRRTRETRIGGPATA